MLAIICLSIDGGCLVSSGLARKLGDGAETAMKAVQGEQESRDATRANRMTLQARGRIEEKVEPDTLHGKTSIAGHCIYMWSLVVKGYVKWQ